MDLGSRGVLVAVWWAVAGALAAFGLAAAFTPFVLLLLPAAGVALVLGLRVGIDRRAFGLLAGAAIVPVRLGWTGGGPTWLLVALVMVAAGLGLAWRPARVVRAG